MIGRGYRHKYLIDGNDGRGIDVAVMMRDETATGEKIEFVSMESHAHVTLADFELHTKELEERRLEANDRIFKRDCLEINVKIGGKHLSLFVVHFKSMSNGRDGIDGRTWTMPVREAESRAVRRIIENRFGEGKTDTKRWMVCGDMNDYLSRITVEGSRHSGLKFNHITEENCGFDPLVSDGFSVNLCDQLPEMERWTLYHSRGPQERHFCQLDYLLASPILADKNPKTVPEIIHAGQPHRTPFPEGQTVDRYPRTGWDRPKASDHSPVVAELNII